MSSLDMRASATLGAPFSPSDLRTFLSTVPDSARVSITTRMGGDQRDPYPTGYIVIANWKEEA